MRHLRASVTVLVLAIAFGGCSNTIVTTPVPPATLDRMWPHNDGRTWNYRLTRTTWPVVVDSAYIYPEVDSVPAVPSFPALLVLMYQDSLGTPATIDTSKYQLQFSGKVEVAPGDSAQLLATSFPTFSGAMNVASLETRLGARAWGSPAALGLESREFPATAATTAPPIFLPGGYWKLTSESIGLYNFGGGQIWKYLISNLSSGVEFSLPLVPALSGEPVLKAYVYGNVTVVTPAATYAGALMVLYVVDYGVSAITDNAGALVGYQRQFHYGWVAYYRDTGPVAGYERLLALAGKRPSKGSAVVRYALTSTSPSP